MHDAAPDLYRALREMLRELEPPTGEPSDAVIIARAALAKAEGR